MLCSIPRITYIFSLILCLTTAIFLKPSLLSARQSNNDLPHLFDRLASREAPSPIDVVRIEREIWRLWMISGRGDVDALMRVGTRALGYRDYDLALESFSQIIAIDPEFSEGWNKRATVRFLRGEFEDSLSDIASTLSLEPRHFGALEGRGMIYENLGQFKKALDEYEQVFLIHPHMKGLKSRIEALRGRTGQRAT